MEKYGTRVAPTDLVVILGGWMTGENNRTSEDDLTCASWSVSSNRNGEVRRVGYGGNRTKEGPYGRPSSVCPALLPAETTKLTPTNRKTGVNRVVIAEYGEYPQTVADERTSEKLERLHDSESLRPTGKNYTFDSVALDDYSTTFKATSYPEYELNGKNIFVF